MNADLNVDGFLSWYLVDGTFVDVHVDEPLITVSLYEPTFGTFARGNAKCDKSDTFSLDFGIRLAQSRAFTRFYPRLIRKLIRSLNAS